jgi:endonuclease/exonuclease/phosphatase family metal-dependent hydrolase
VSATVRIVTFNLAFHLPWSERQPEVMAWFEELRPDVVLLQENVGAPGESWADQLADIMGYSVAHGGTVGQMRYANAALTRWPVDRCRSIELPCEPPPAGMGLPNEPIGAHAVHLATGGMDFIGVHLAPAPQKSALRLRQVLALDDECSTIDAARRPMPVVMGGDFNATPDADPIRFLVGQGVVDGRSTYYQEAWQHAGQGPGYTLDRSNPWHAATTLPNARIDFVFIGYPYFRAGSTMGLRETTGTIERAALAFNRPLTGTFASDHFGLSVDVRTNG